MIDGHGERTLRLMRASLSGRDELVVRVQEALALATKKEAEHVINAVVGGLEATLLNNLSTNGFALKIGELWQILSASQAEHPKKDSIHRQDHPDQG